MLLAQPQGLRPPCVREQSPAVHPRACGGENLLRRMHAWGRIAARRGGKPARGAQCAPRSRPVGANSHSLSGGSAHISASDANITQRSRRARRSDQARKSRPGSPSPREGCGGSAVLTTTPAALNLSYMTFHRRQWCLCTNTPELEPDIRRSVAQGRPYSAPCDDGSEVTECT